MRIALARLAGERVSLFRSTVLSPRHRASYQGPARVPRRAQAFPAERPPTRGEEKTLEKMAESTQTSVLLGRALTTGPRNTTFDTV